MGSLLQDVRFGLRLIRQSPGFAVLAILTFALGIGVNVAIFSIVDAIVLRPIAVNDPDRIVRILNEDPAHRDRGNRSSWIEIGRFNAESRAFTGVTASDRRGVIVRDGDDTRLLLVNVVADNYFDVFQLTPAAGRTFTSAEAARAGAPPMVVLSYDLWRRQYNSDPHIVGQTITASDVACLVVGVLPRTFRGTELFLNPDLYLPLSTWLAMNPGERVRVERPQARNLEAFGRLRRDVTVAQASSALEPVQQQLAVEYPQQESGRRLTVRFDRDTRGPQVRVIGALLLGIAALILLIAAVNIANLLLVRGEARWVEIVTRIALGASRARTVRQLVTEAAVFAALGAVGAVLFAGWAISLMPLLMPAMDFPIGFDFRIDTRVLLFAGAATLLVVVLAALLPAIAASQVALTAGLKSPTMARQGRWRDVMVVGQIAITVVLLIASGLLVRTLINVRQMDPGFDARGDMLIVTLDVRKFDLAREHAYYRSMIDTFKGVPGIVSSTAASRIPMWGSGGGAAVLAWTPGLPEADREGVRIGFAVVAPDYFSTLGARIVRGRGITDRDDEQAAPVAVLNESAAQVLWPNGDAIGRRFRVNGPSGREAEVVGIVQDGRYLDMTEKQRAYMFLPLFCEQQIFGSRWGAEVVVVRTDGPAGAYAKTVRDTLRRIDPDVAVLGLRTMEDHVRAALYSERLMVQLVGSMGVLGLLLAAIGLFGVISYSVARRTREIGIRIALGAHPRDVARLVLVRASMIALAGIAAGVLLALIAAQVMTSAIYGVSARDPLTYAAAIVTMTLVALAAAAIPARRAAAVNPFRALRME
jgi:putative ABC transport system permease protein